MQQFCMLGAEESRNGWVRAGETPKGQAEDRAGFHQVKGKKRQRPGEGTGMWRS